MMVMSVALVGSVVDMLVAKKNVVTPNRYAVAVHVAILPTVARTNAVLVKTVVPLAAAATHPVAAANVVRVAKNVAAVSVATLPTVAAASVQFLQMTVGVLT